MKTLKIKPVVAYANGRRFVATAISVDSRADDLFSSVKFRHILLNAAGVQVGESQTQFDYTPAEPGASKLLTISEDQSIGSCKWDASAEGAYVVVAESLGLEIDKSGDAADEEKMTFSEVA